MQKANGQLEKTTGPPSQRLSHKVQDDADALPLCGDLRSPGIMEWRNGPLGLRDDDDDDYSCSRHSQKVVCEFL